jgi:hypothetical protein
MRALSLRQPWAAIVVHFGKHVENRVWNTSFRGEFLIHAAKEMTRVEFDEAYRFAQAQLGEKMPHEVDLRELCEFGGVVGIARLVDVVPPCAGPGGRCQCRAALSFGRSWHMPDQYGFLLEDVRPLPFRPCRGLQRFFNLAEAA